MVICGKILQHKNTQKRRRKQNSQVSAKLRRSCMILKNGCKGEPSMNCYKIYNEKKVQTFRHFQCTKIHVFKQINNNITLKYHLSTFDFIVMAGKWSKSVLNMLIRWYRIRKKHHRLYNIEQSCIQTTHIGDRKV